MIQPNSKSDPFLHPPPSSFTYAFPSLHPGEGERVVIALITALIINGINYRLVPINGANKNSYTYDFFTETKKEKRDKEREDLSTD